MGCRPGYLEPNLREGDEGMRKGMIAEPHERRRMLSLTG